VRPLPVLRIGSRASPLARRQAEWVAERVEGCTALVWVRSDGDPDVEASLVSPGGADLYTEALDRALREDRCDAAVHSLEDLPAAGAPGIALACVPAREDPRDALVTRDGAALAELPPHARVGTDSPRRAAQLLRFRPDVGITPVRGEVDTRLRRLEEGQVDALVLALADLSRLGLAARASEVFEPDRCLPAAGQGALGITIRAGDAPAEARLAVLRDVRAAACTTAERAALSALGVGCHAPIGALAEVVGGRVRLRLRVLSEDGIESLEAGAEGALGEARAVGERAAGDLLAAGGARLLKVR